LAGGATRIDPSHGPPPQLIPSEASLEQLALPGTQRSWPPRSGAFQPASGCFVAPRPKGAKESTATEGPWSDKSRNLPAKQGPGLRPILPPFNREQHPPGAYKVKQWLWPSRHCPPPPDGDRNRVLSDLQTLGRFSTGPAPGVEGLIEKKPLTQVSTTFSSPKCPFRQISHQRKNEISRCNP